MECVSFMTTDQLHVASTLLKIVNITALYLNHHCSTLGVFNHSMITAIKDLKLGKNDFENNSPLEMISFGNVPLI